MDWNPSPMQREPEGDWLTWLMVADRGAGTTRAGAETAARWARQTPDTQILVVGPRNSLHWCFGGPAGLLERFNPDEIKAYDESRLILTLQNGSRMRGTLPGGLHGLGGDRAWASDVHLWTRRDYDQLWFCLRESRDLKIVANSSRHNMPGWVVDLTVAAHNPESRVVITQA